MKKILGMSEQLVCSVGSFSLFIVAANRYNAVSFSDFALKWVVVQLLLGVAIQWAFLPITSYNGGSDFLFLVAMKKIVRLLAVAVIAIPAYLFFILDKVSFYEVCICYGLFVVVVINDMYRYLKIRELEKKKVVLFSFARWGLILILVFIASYIKLNDGNVILMAILVGNAVPLCMVIYEMYEKVMVKGSRNNKNDLSHNDPELLMLSGANYLNTISSSFAFSRIDPIAFGAMQAFRSISNFLPVIIQYLETHVSSEMVNEEKISFIRTGKVCIILLASFLILLTAHFFQQEITLFLYGDNFSEYSYVIVYTIIISVLQSVNRVLSVEFRLRQKLGVFNVISGAVLISSGFLFVLAMNNYDVSYLLLVLAVTPACQFVINIFFKHKWLK